MTYSTNSEKETELLGTRFASTLKPGSVVAFFGDLGMGKTAFIRGMAKGLDVKERVCSPTFTIVNEYEGRVPLFHFDMYRLSSADELFEIGWEDYLSRNGVCAIEWSENVCDIFDGTEITVRFSRTGEQSRTIEIGGADEL